MSGRPSVRPPRLAEWLLAWSAPRRDREAILGDMTEEFVERASVDARAARSWYRSQLVRSLAANLRRRRARGVGPCPRKGDRMVAGVIQDLRFAVRTMSRAPAFAASIVLTLAFGMAASTIVFSMVDGVVLHPFPYPDPDRLVTVGSEFPKLRSELSFFENLSPAEYLDIAEQSRTLRGVVAWDMGNRQVAGAGAPENLFSAFWWGDAFATLGVTPALGRGFLTEEIRRAEHVAVISHRVWRTRFGGDPALVGGTLHVNGVPFTVIGVMPPKTLVYGTDLWIPMPVPPQVFPRERRQFQVLARLAPDATLADAEAELSALAARVDAAHRAQLPEYEGWRLRPVTWTEANVREVRPAAVVLAGAVALVMLLACANVASLLLARTTARRREVAIRVALGARRGRLLRQLLVESVALSLAAGLGGAALALVGIQALAAALSRVELPVPGEVVVNARVLLFTAVTSLIAGVGFGLAPALHSLRDDVQAALRTEGAAITPGSTRLRLQRLLVGVEVALATVLLAAGGLLVNSFFRLQRVDPRFDPRNVLTFRLTLPRERYDGRAIGDFFGRLVDALKAQPRVRAVAAASQFPPMGFARSPLRVEGEASVADDELPAAFSTIASRELFRALGLPLLRGRTFSEHDGPERPGVAVVNEAAARRLFGGEALGRRFRLGREPSAPALEVVGVVGSARNRGLDAPPEPEVYLSLDQSPGDWNQLFVLVRADGEPRSILPGIREQVRALDPEQPLYAVQTVEDAFDAQAFSRRLATVLVSALAAFALGLALSGIYAVVSYAAAARTREIGLRMAIGAGAGRVRALIVGQALVPVAAGLACGLAGALLLSKPLGRVLYEVRGTDPLTLGIVVVLFAATALLAAYGPARRASRLDPVRALRSE